MHGHYKSRKKMLASTLHLTTTPADHHHHQQPGDNSDCPEKHHHRPPTEEGEPRSSSQDPTACRRLTSCTQFHIFKKATTPHDLPEKGSRLWSSAGNMAPARRPPHGDQSHKKPPTIRGKAP